MATKDEIEAQAVLISERDNIGMKDARDVAKKELEEKEKSTPSESVTPSSQPDSTIVKEIDEIISRLYKFSLEELLEFDKAYKILVAEKKDPQQAQINEFNRKLQTLDAEYKAVREAKTDPFRCLDLRDEMDKIKEEMHKLELKIARESKPTKSTKTGGTGEKTPKPIVPYVNGTETFLWNGQGKRGETILKWLRDAGLAPDSKDKAIMKQCADKVAEWKKAGTP